VKTDSGSRDVESAYKSFAKADFKQPLRRRPIALRHRFVAIHIVHLLHWIIVSIGKVKLHRPKADLVTSRVCCLSNLAFIALDRHLNVRR